VGAFTNIFKMKAIDRYESIELAIPANAGQSRFNFLDIPQLRSDVTKDIVVQAIKTFSAAEKPIDFNGNAVATVAQLQNAELTLYVDGEESIFRIPLTELVNGQNFTNTFFSQQIPDEFNNLIIDWTKSYITADVPFNTDAPNTAFVFLFGIAYRRYKAGTMAAIKAARGDVSNLPAQIQS
jgi:hypothetical protein